MKRILSIVLILILSLSVLTACGDKKSTSYNMDNAKATLVELYPELAPTKDNPTPATRKDFHVVKVLTCTDGKYTVAWTTNNDAVKVVDYEGTNTLFNKDTAVTVKVPAVEADLAYTLTATITDPDGKTTTTVTFNLVVPAAVAGSYSLPVAGEAYKLYLYQATAAKILYFKGVMDGDYLATTDDFAAATDIYFEAVTGGYLIYFMNGDAKTYITANAYEKEGKTYPGCHFSLTTDTPTKVWTYDTVNGIIEFYDEIAGKSDTFFAGTHGSYNTISMSGSYYKADLEKGTQFPARISLTSNGAVTAPNHEHNFVNGKCSCGEEDPNYVAPEGFVLTAERLELSHYNTEVATATINGVEFAWLNLGSFGDGIQVKDKEGNTSSLWNTTAFSSPIAKIELVASSTKSTYDNADCAIYSFGNAVDNYTCTVKLSTVAGTSTYTITPDAQTYTYFRFEHDLGYTQYWDSITIVLVDGTTISAQ